MKSFSARIADLRKIGYGLASAQAKTAHEALLLAMHRSGFKKGGTIKGGVVMSYITADIRRTTMDMDVAFIHKSISETAIRKFILNLNGRIPKVRFAVFGTVGELLHEDYRGKRVYVDVTDGSVKAPIRIKVDIGVHKYAEMSQLDYSFVLGDGEETAELQINSMEQIFAEKLKSLIKLKFLSTRAKDVFDMYYLMDQVDRCKLKAYLRVLMFDNKRCKTKSVDDAVAALEETFTSRKFMKELGKVRVNWLQTDPTKAANALVRFVAGLKDAPARK